MKFLATSINRADPSPWIPDEAARMAQLQGAGLVEQAFLKADRTGAVLILEASDQGAAERALQTLPLVQHGVTSFEVTAVLPAPVPA